MLSMYALKPAFQQLLRPIMSALAGAGVTANQVTVATVVVSAATGLALSLRPEMPAMWLLLPLVLLLRMGLNAIDGMLAREHNMESRLGSILNELGDVISDAVLYLPLTVIPGLSSAVVVATVLLAIASEMTGVVGIQIGANRRYDGPMGKSDRAVVFGTIGLALGLGVPVGAWLQAVLGMIVVLLVMTIVNRARRALEVAR